MTISEINSYIKAIQQREKNNCLNQYLNASLIANFVGSVIDGKPIPPIQEVFPEFFAEDIALINKEQNDKALMMYKEQMIDFAKRHNQRRKIKDGENN